MSNLFKRDVSDVGFEMAEAARDVLEGMAELSPAEKKAYVADLHPRIRKALRNSYLLAQATNDIPADNEGIFQHALRRQTVAR